VSTHKSIEQVTANKGADINEAVTEENMNKRSTDAVIPKASGKTLTVLKYGQETSYYYGSVSCQIYV
jgi:hypothetical protein